MLEVGTGHGSLTLHLARAIHAANASASSPKSCENAGESPTGSQQRQRNAMVHTLDISSKHSAHAKRIIQGFRQRIYEKDVEFHVGTLAAWVKQQIAIRKLDPAAPESFLSHVIMDVPEHEGIEDILPLLHEFGALLLFSPSVSQIMAVVDSIRKQNLPLRLERALELGNNSTGGREWDIRGFKPRKFTRSTSTSEPPGTSEDRDANDGQSTLDVEHSREDEKSHDASVDEQEWRMVCRPRVGYMITAGGFLGFWRKTI